MSPLPTSAIGGGQAAGGGWSPVRRPAATADSGMPLLALAVALSLVVHAIVGMLLYRQAVSRLDPALIRSQMRLVRMERAPLPELDEERLPPVMAHHGPTVPQDQSPAAMLLEEPRTAAVFSPTRTLIDFARLAERMATGSSATPLVGPTDPQVASLPPIDVHQGTQGTERPAGSGGLAGAGGDPLGRGHPAGPFTGSRIPLPGLSGPDLLDPRRPDPRADLGPLGALLPGLSLSPEALNPPTRLDDDFEYALTVFQPQGKEGPGHFRIDITARRSLSKLKHMPKDVIFLVDTSSSIWQNWVDAIVRGLRDGLDQLNPGDRFNIVLFNEGPRFLSTRSIQPVTVDSLENARKFLRTAASGGMTDVNQVLSRLLVRDVAVERVYYLVLISDGVPTEGVRDTRDIINRITRDNDLAASIYCVGVGENQNRELLDFLAYRNRGFCVHVERKGDVAKAIPDLLSRLRYPLIKDVRMNMAGLDMARVFPHDLPNIHQGQTLPVFGSFDRPGDFTLRLTGSNGGKPVDSTSIGDLRKGKPGDAGIPRNWAFWKLHDLYSRSLGPEGMTPALRQQITDLQKEFKLKVVP